LVGSAAKSRSYTSHSVNVSEDVIGSHDVWRQLSVAINYEHTWFTFFALGNDNVDDQGYDNQR